MLLAPMLSALGCGSLEQMLRPPMEQGSAPAGAAAGAGEDPPPLHTGGLSVLKGHPDAPGQHGSRVAAAVAAGIAAPVIGAIAVQTVANCASPDAGADCLAGPGPGGDVGDAGAPYEPPTTPPQ
jgi:hypothetical protein